MNRESALTNRSDIAADDLPEPPPVVSRAPFARWLFDRDLRHEDAAEILKATRQAVGFWCLPAGHRQRTTPRAATRQRIALWTRGEISPETFDLPTEAQS